MSYDLICNMYEFMSGTLPILYINIGNVIVMYTFVLLTLNT